MAGVAPLPDEPVPEPIARPSRWRHVLRILAFPIVLLGLAALALLALDTPFGHRFIADRIAAFAPPSGLRIAIGRIEGSIYGQAQLRDVSLADPQGFSSGCRRPSSTGDRSTGSPGASMCGHWPCGAAR